MKKVLLIFTLIISVSGIAQQESQYANIAFNPYIVNSAAGGLTDVMQFEVTGRTQWLGYNGGPRTMTLIGHSQFKLKKEENILSEFNVKDKSLFKSPEVTTGSVKHIVGGMVMNDAIGPFSKTSVNGSYAIHLPFFKSFNFGLGIGMGWSNFSIDGSRVVLYQEDDLSYEQFLGSTPAQDMIDANAGLVFYNQNIFIGISTSQVFRNSMKFDDIETSSNFERHYFLVAKYKIELNPKWSLEPNLVGKFTKNSPSSFDIGSRFIHNQASWLSFQYRTSNALIFQIGSNLVKNIYFAYSYELGIGSIQTASNSTHEVQIGLYIGNNRKIKKELKESEKSE